MPSASIVAKRCGRLELRVNLVSRLVPGGWVWASSQTYEPTSPRRGSSQIQTLPPFSAMYFAAGGVVTIFIGDIESQDDAERGGRRGAGLLVRRFESAGHSDHRHVLAGRHDRLPWLLLLRKPVVQRPRDEDHHEHGPDDGDLVQEADVEVQQLHSLGVVVALDRLWVGEDPEVVRRRRRTRIPSSDRRRWGEEVQHHRETPEDGDHIDDLAPHAELER